MTTDSNASELRLPVTGAGFRWEGTALLADTGRARGVFTTRVGGVCPPPFDSLTVSHADAVDAPKPADWHERVLENRRIAARPIGAGGDWVMVRQVHGAQAVDAELVASSNMRPDADAVWTSGPRPIAVVVADCIPVLLVADGKIAAAHAGWRGLVAGVVQNAARAIGADEAFIGPGIGPCCYQVSPDVAAQFAQPGPKIDLWAAAAEKAREAGVRTIHTARLCTSCHPELFFSHRRDKGRTGRQALVAVLP